MFREFILFILCYLTKHLSTALILNTLDLTTCSNTAKCMINNVLEDFIKITYCQNQDKIRQIYFNNTTSDNPKYRNILLVNHIRKVITPTTIYLKTCDPKAIIEEYNEHYVPKNNYLFQTIEILEKHPAKYLDKVDHELNECLKKIATNTSTNSFICEQKNVTFLNVENTLKVHLTKIYYISLERNNITIISRNSSNLVLWARFLVMLNLKHNPIIHIDCDAFSRSRYLRFLETTIDMNQNNIELKCIMNSNRNIQQITYNEHILWNKCNSIELMNENNLSTIEYEMTEIKNLKQFMVSCKRDSVRCEIKQPINSSLIIQDSDFIDFPNIRQLILNTSDIIYLRNIQNASIYDLRIKHNGNNLGYMIFRNCKLEWEIFYSYNYLPYVANDVSKYYSEHNTDNFINFENCLKKFCNSKKGTVLYCENTLISRTTNYEKNYKCWDSVTAMILHGSKIDCWKPKTVPIFKNLYYLGMMKLKINWNCFDEKTFITNFPNVRNIDLLGTYYPKIRDIFSRQTQIKTLRFGAWPGTYIFNLGDQINVYKNTSQNITSIIKPYSFSKDCNKNYAKRFEININDGDNMLEIRDESLCKLEDELILENSIPTTIENIDYYEAIMLNNDNSIVHKDKTDHLSYYQNYSLSDENEDNIEREKSSTSKQVATNEVHSNLLTKIKKYFLKISLTTSILFSAPMLLFFGLMYLREKGK